MGAECGPRWAVRPGSTGRPSSTPLSSKPDLGATVIAPWRRAQTARGSFESVRSHATRVLVTSTLLLSAATPDGLSAGVQPPVRVPRHLDRNGVVRISFHPRASLPPAGYYYAVAVLVHYSHAEQSKPPERCATSSAMDSTEYAAPSASGVAIFRLTPEQVHGRYGGHGFPRPRGWCADASYLGGIYAVPHPAPCTASYPCKVIERPCAGVGPGCVRGVVANPQEPEYREAELLEHELAERVKHDHRRAETRAVLEAEDREAIERRPYSYPGGLPAPLDSSTRVVAHFRLHFGT
jgi:hypothetical protein